MAINTKKSEVSLLRLPNLDMILLKHDFGFMHTATHIGKDIFYLGCQEGILAYNAKNL